jgi:hypothetical protein
MKQTEIQEALFDKLNESEVLKASVTGIYDNVPQGTEYPYVVIGEDTGIAWDTDDCNGVNSTLTLHIWTRYSGRKECKDIMNIVYGVLHRCNLNITGMVAVTCDWEFSETYSEGDGETRHGVMRFRVIAHEEES